MIGIMGILCKGCAFLPVKLDLPDLRIHNMLEDADVSVIVLTRGVSRTLPASLKTFFIEAAPANSQPMAFTCNAQPTYLMYVLFTSGSTGRPKGVIT